MRYDIILVYRTSKSIVIDKLLISNCRLIIFIVDLLLKVVIYRLVLHQAKHSSCVKILLIIQRSTIKVKLRKTVNIQYWRSMPLYESTLS